MGWPWISCLPLVQLEGPLVDEVRMTRAGDLLDLSHDGQGLTVAGLSEAGLVAIQHPRAKAVLIKFVAKFGRPIVPIAGTAQVVRGTVSGTGEILEQMLDAEGLL